MRRFLTVHAVIALTVVPAAHAWAADDPGSTGARRERIVGLDTTTPEARQPSVSKSWRIHVASLDQDTDPSDLWDALRERYRVLDEVDGWQTEPIRIAGEGVLERLVAGPFTDEVSAYAACRTIRRAGGYCGVLGP